VASSIPAAGGVGAVAEPFFQIPCWIFALIFLIAALALSFFIRMANPLLNSQSEWRRTLWVSECYTLSINKK